jgi:murein DD-endopeptidase MepM/ murein hydrolase activator NlpD
VVEGDTLATIAGRFGVEIETVIAANQITDPDALSVGQVLVIPGARFTPAPVPATPPPDPRLTGFIFPIEGACLPEREALMPNAPREYRHGVHEGVDFYAGENCVEIVGGTPAVAVKDGTIIRAGHGFAEMTPAELEEILARTAAQGYTDEAALDRFRGRQVWIDHGDGIVSRYSHLSAIPLEIREGVRVGAGEVVGYVGDSGTPEAVTNPGVEFHLHWELRVGDSYLGAGLPPDEVRELYERLFSSGP